jgi:hypothetical protein
MKRLLFAALSVLLLSSALPYRRPEPVVNPRDPLLSGIEAAALKTGAPEATLDGLAFAESSGRPDPRHIDPADKGRFGLHEDPAYHAERARRYGEYDALDPYDAAYITGRLYADALAALGNPGSAICAHKQGVEGVKRDGPLGWYLERVMKGATR